MHTLSVTSGALADEGALHNHAVYIGKKPSSLHGDDMHPKILVHALHDIKTSTILCFGTG